MTAFVAGLGVAAVIFVVFALRQEGPVARVGIVFAVAAVGVAAAVFLASEALQR